MDSFPYTKIIMDASILDFITSDFMNAIAHGVSVVSVQADRFMGYMMVLVFTLAGLNWAFSPTPAWEQFLKKVLFVSFFMYLLTNWQDLVDMLHDSFLQIGLNASGTDMDATTLFSPSFFGNMALNLFETMMDNVTEYITPSWSWAIQGILHMMTLCATIVCIIVLAIKMILIMMEFRLVTMAGMIVIPFGIYKKTRFMSDKMIGFIFAVSLKMMVMGFLFGLSAVFLQDALEVEPGDFVSSLTMFMGVLTLLVCVFYMPKLAVALVTGETQESVIEEKLDQASDAIKKPISSAIQGLGRGVLAGITLGASEVYGGAKDMAGVGKNSAGNNMMEKVGSKVGEGIGKAVSQAVGSAAGATGISAAIGAAITVLTGGLAAPAAVAGTAGAGAVGAGAAGAGAAGAGAAGAGAAGAGAAGAGAAGAGATGAGAAGATGAGAGTAGAAGSGAGTASTGASSVAGTAGKTAGGTIKSGAKSLAKGAKNMAKDKIKDKVNDLKSGKEAKSFAKKLPGKAKGMAEGFKGDSQGQADMGASIETDDEDNESENDVF
jgi:type IV secretion system protein TrbL